MGSGFGLGLRLEYLFRSCVTAVPEDLGMHETLVVSVRGRVGVGAGVSVGARVRVRRGRVRRGIRIRVRGTPGTADHA